MALWICGDLPSSARPPRNRRLTRDTEKGRREQPGWQERGQRPVRRLPRAQCPPPPRPGPARRHTPCGRARAGRGGRGVPHVRGPQRGGEGLGTRRGGWGQEGDRRRRSGRGSCWPRYPWSVPRVADARGGSRGQVGAHRPSPSVRPRALPTLRVAAAGQHADGLAGPGHPQLLQVHGGHGGAETGRSVSAREARCRRSRPCPAPAPPPCEVTAAHAGGAASGVGSGGGGVQRPRSGRVCACPQGP